jgi:hypothetical protein
MAFYQCPNCKKVWQYPIGKCPECFLNLERIKRKTAKVIAVSKVEIPSIFHPKVPYFVLVLEDENRNRWIKKTKKEYKIGEEIEKEKLVNQDGVIVVKVKYDYFEVIEKIFEVFGQIELKEDSKILILPTLEKPSHQHFRDNTSSEFLDATLKFLLERKVKPENIKVCAQSFDEIEIGIKAQRSGLLEICQKYNVLPFDLSKGNFVKKGDLEISEEVFKSDLILNLPILKMGRALATENLFFFLKKENYLAQKYLYSEKEIFEKLREKLPKILTIAEARHIQDEKGFTNYLFLVLSSFDPRNLDLVFFKITQREKLPEILEGLEIEKIETVGDIDF